MACRLRSKAANVTQVHIESAVGGRKEVRPASIHADRQYVAVRRALPSRLRASVYRRLPARHRPHVGSPHQPGLYVSRTIPRPSASLPH